MKSLSEPRKKIGRQFEALAHYQKEGFAYPLTAEIDLTWRCALNCKGCHSKWLHKDQELELQEIAHILSQLKQYGCQSVTWSGGGDPMESPYFWDALEEAASLGLRQGVYSYFPQPSQERIHAIGAWCDFAYTHPFKTDGLDHRIDDNCTWTAGFLLDKDNWHRVNRMVESVDLSFFDYVDFRPLSPINAPNAPSLDYGWIPEALEVLQELYSSNPQVTWAEYKFLALMTPEKGRDYKECMSTDFVACIGPNGDMYECINRRGFPDSIIGNLLKEDLSDIWAR